jgi:hypothetical protein
MLRDIILGNFTGFASGLFSGNPWKEFALPPEIDWDARSA